MNVNYVRADSLPDYDSYGKLLESLGRGDYFVTTGEVLLPNVRIATESAHEIAIKADLRWTYPLQFAEVVWGDGAQTFRESFPLDTTRSFGSSSHEWKVKAEGWKWARVAVWDVARNGAFVNPVHR